ncbi:Coiled-coil domain-containing protein -like protein [Toxocara canis]|uniref:Coiled-coil domain-containing protein-like protein n=1 Tax=Toxocara canis TaxID=6265 RepID=A0A0B2W075_TOXCA|nr:Coiled-coil domain-containing protein -like protein [Toxocara canis]
MGERKGQNFYYPPDFDYKKHRSLNAYHGTHALRERAAKIKQGILIIRFEMPFNIWCLGCNNHIGMGVRYNAEKKKVGMYYTTPVYEFRMKCHLCDNYFVIRTDPEHFDYELVEGCRRQEKRYDPSTIAQLGAVDRTFNRQLESDKMFKVEHKEKDETKGAEAGNQVEKLEWIQERMRDDFAANQALRRNFRREKQELKDQRVMDEGLQKRTSLDLKLLPESDEDKKLAAIITRYKNVTSFEEQQAEIRSSISGRPFFESSTSSNELKRNPKKALSLKIRQKRLCSAFDGPSTSSDGAMTVKDIGITLKKSRTNVLDSAQQSELNDELYVPNVEDEYLVDGEVGKCLSDGCVKEEWVEQTNISLIPKQGALVADYESSSDSDNDKPLI